jgi:hypothetical protein
MTIWTISCSTLSVTDVGTATCRQIEGPLSRNSMRMVHTSLKLSEADLVGFLAIRSA